MDTKDLEITTITNASQKCVVRITHTPTGISVAGDGVGQYRLKQKLITELKEKVER